MSTTSIKVKYRPSSVGEHEGVIYYQIIHERKVRQLHTEYHIWPDEWDESRSMVAIKQSCDRKPLLIATRDGIRHDIERLTRIIREMENEGLSFTADDVITDFRRYMREYSLSAYVARLVGLFKRDGKIRTAETYMATLNSFRMFLQETGRGSRVNHSHGLSPHAAPANDIMIDCITSEIMEAYQAWHKRRGNSPNTISFYNRILRAVYHRCADTGIFKDRNPFRHVYTGVEKTVKRALPLSHIKRIRKLDLTADNQLDYARDMFLMSFYLRGMSFIDMAFLKKTDLKHGSVIYRRRKTGQRLIIGWTNEMQLLLDKYPVNPTQYLLPIIKSTGVKERYAYKNAGDKINYNLKRVGEMAGLNIPLTMYVARHSWASAAKAKGIPISVISEGMGHDSEMTTRIYLATLDTSVVDKANSIIISSI